MYVCFAEECIRKERWTNELYTSLVQWTHQALNLLFESHSTPTQEERCGAEMARLPEDQPLATINANNGTLFHQSHPSAASENSSTSRYGYAEDDSTQSFDGIATTDSRYSLETIATNSSVFLSEEEEEVYWEEAWRLFFAVSLSAILLGAVIGNIMVVMVMVKHRGMRTRTNMFLCSLACSDLLCALLNMPISLITVIHGRWVFGTTLCQINGFLTPFTFVTSIHTLMYIAVHKYISIKWPFSHVLTHFRILLMILCAWLWGGVASYLTVHGLNAVSYKPYTTQCGPDYPHDGRTYFHEGFIYLTCYLIPLLVMAFCYIVMCYEIKVGFCYHYELYILLCISLCNVQLIYS